MTDPRSHWPLAGYDELRDRLLAAYSSVDRGYHDVRHLEEVLDRLVELLSVEGAGVDRDALLLAAWFHDAVYDGDADDEERSAELAADALAGFDTALAAEVARLVRTTAAHRPGEDDLAGRLLCDADLAILASDPERYADYVAGVRREFAAVSDPEFRKGRAAVLRALLAKPTLFHSEHARSAWEERARANVTRELAALEG